MNDVETFVSLQASGYIPTKTEAADAIEKAEKELYNRIMAFDFENQL